MNPDRRRPWTEGPYLPSGSGLGAFLSVVCRADPTPSFRFISVSSSTFVAGSSSSFASRFLPTPFDHMAHENCLEVFLMPAFIERGGGRGIDPSTPERFEVEGGGVGDGGRGGEGDLDWAVWKF